MARPAFGTIQEFHPESEQISAYLERINMYLKANDVKDDKWVPILLSVIGAKTYALLRSLVAPALPQDKSFASLVATLKQHFEPKPVVIAERFRFHRHDQAPGKSVAEYVAELRQLSTHCKLEAYLDQALRDRLVCGLRNESV